MITTQLPTKVPTTSVTAQPLIQHSQINETEELVHSMPSVSGVESVRSKYILSKTIDGLENSLIGVSNLTVYMMEQMYY